MAASCGAAANRVRECAVAGPEVGGGCEEHDQRHGGEQQGDGEPTDYRDPCEVAPVPADAPGISPGPPWPGQSAEVLAHTIHRASRVAPPEILRRKIPAGERKPAGFLVTSALTPDPECPATPQSGHGWFDLALESPKPAELLLVAGQLDPGSTSLTRPTPDLRFGLKLPYITCLGRIP